MISAAHTNNDTRMPPISFLTCVSHTAHVIAIGWTSVRPFIRPSVCLSVTLDNVIVSKRIVSKRLNLSSNYLHCLVAP